MEVLIKFAYTGSISWQMVSNVPDFIRDADYLGFDDLKEEGIKYLATNLHPLNAIEGYYLSDEWNSTLLKEASQNTIIKNFETLRENDGFLQLSMESLKDILSSVPFIYSSEKIFEGVLRWVVEDYEERKLHLMDLFQLIKVGYADSNMIHRIAQKLFKGSKQQM